MESVKMKTKHIAWIDGLKGISCFLIFTYHFVIAFYPAMHSGIMEESKFDSHIDVALATQPYGLIKAYSVVCLFLILSSYVISVQIFHTKEENLRQKVGTILLRRYPRLMLPAFAMGMFYFVYLEIAYPLHIATHGNEISFFRAIWNYSVSMWVFSNAKVMGVFWTLFYLLRCSFIVVCFTVFDKEEYKYMPLLYLVLLYPLRCIEVHYISIGMGILLADMVYYRRIDQWIQGANSSVINLWNNKRFNDALALIALIVCFYFGCFPVNLRPEKLYGFLAFGYDHIAGFSSIMHSIGAFFLMCSICLFTRDEKRRSTFLNGKVIQCLGKISFSIYLSHIFVIDEFSYFFHQKLESTLNNYYLTTILNYVVTTVLMLLFAVIFYRLIEKPCNKLTQKIKL